MKPTQVMIVEDEALVGIDIQNNLINFGYNVVGISNSGEAAIENATKSRPEIVLMDIRLKGEMDGIETAKQIHKNLGIPIIYLTAYADDKTLAKALEASPSGYLLKPFVPNELHTSIQTAIKKNEANKEQKLERIKYIQNNILKNLEVKKKLEELENNKEYYQIRKMEKLRKRLSANIFHNLMNENKSFESDSKNNLDFLMGASTFTQILNSIEPRILPLEKFSHFLDFSKDELLKMGNLISPILVHPEDFNLIDNYFEKITSVPGSISEIEIRLKHKSGIWRWFSIRGLSNKTKENNDSLLHCVKDITWFKNLQYTSHIAREKFAAISNNPYFGIAILDTDGKFMNINPSLEHLSGYTKEDLNRQNFSNFIGLKELRVICQNFEKLKSGLINTFQTEAFIYTKYKGAFWGYIVFNAIYNPERTIDRIVCTVVDISESKLFEKNNN